jgi:VWFA-related protein
MFETRTASGALRQKQVLSVLLVLAAALHASYRATPPPAHLQENPPSAVISQEVRLVILPATVRDRTGHFVSGLHASNFEVYEEGKRQQITVFRDADVPVTVGIVVDHSGSMAARRREVNDGATAFVEVSNPQDREFVVNFTNNISFGLPTNVAFTNHVEDLKKALSIVPPGGATALYDAVAVALNHLQRDKADKNVLLLISDGGDNASTHTFGQVIRMAQASNVVIYAIGMLDPYSADQNPHVLKKFARETGGEAYLANSSDQVVSVCRQIAADIRHQYTLGYDPPDGPAGFRKVRVTVHAPGHGKVSIRTRSSYFFSPSSSGQTITDSAKGR